MDTLPTILSQLKTLRDITAKRLNVTLAIKYNSKINTITLINIERDHSLETRGNGTKVMQELLGIADEYKAKIRLDVESHSPEEQAGLIKYYKGFGFTINNKDYAYSPDDKMYIQGKLKNGEVVQGENFLPTFLMNRTPKKVKVVNESIMTFKEFITSNQ